VVQVHERSSPGVHTACRCAEQVGLPAPGETSSAMGDVNERVVLVSVRATAGAKPRRYAWSLLS